MDLPKPIAPSDMITPTELPSKLGNPLDKNEDIGAIPPEWWAYSRYLDEQLGEGLPSIESDFQVFIGCNDVSGIEYPAVDRVATNKYLYSVIDCKIPNLGFSFFNQPAGSGFIESALEPGESINVSYWDTSQQSESRIIEKLYLAQFTKLGTFRLGYRSNFLSIQIGKMKIVLSDGVVTRPLPMNLNAASNGLMRYRFSFAYETYHVEYLDAVPTKIPSAAFENLKF